MNDKKLNVNLWIIAVLITMVLVVYQRITGPTYPKSGSVMIGNQQVSYTFLRSYDTGKDAPVSIKVENKDITGKLSYKRYKSHDDWTEVDMKRQDGELTASLPTQPPAGKVMYVVKLFKDGQGFVVTEDPVILRFKGTVPKAILAPHIFFMFISLLFGFRAGIEALFRQKDTRFYVGYTLVTLFIGGLILGPIVQKYAFGAYWTGWPFGHDLTDNKTIVVFVFWLISWLYLRKNALHKTWVLLATVVMILVYVIPHSAWGSEIDYAKENTGQVKTNTSNP